MLSLLRTRPGEERAMKPTRHFIDAVAAIVLMATVFTGAGESAAQSPSRFPRQMTTPDRIDTSIGVLEFEDGAPTRATATRVYDYLDLMHGVEAFVNAYQGASTAAQLLISTLGLVCRQRA